MKKNKLNKLLLLLFLFFVVAGCGHDENENKDASNDSSSVEIVKDIDADFDVKEILSKYSVHPEQEQAVIKIMDGVQGYLNSNIGIIMDEFRRDKNRAKNIDSQFAHGKISPKTLEFWINDKIEEYNDEHMTNRLHTVTFEIVMDTASIYPFFNKPLIKNWLSYYESGIYNCACDKWKEQGENTDEKEQIIIKGITDAYFALFKAENLIEQMIGVKNNKIIEQ